MNIETRPGYLTTEFWLTVIINLCAAVQLVADPFAIPDRFVLLVGTISNAAYAISRGIAKANVANVPAPPQPPVN